LLYVLFSSKKDENTELLLDSTEIKKIQSCKYLGIYIDDKSQKLKVYNDV